MERSRDVMGIPWGALWSVTDLSIADIFQFNLSNITEDCMENARKYMPQITDLEVTLTGSRKECSWISKLFRTDTDLANLEADFLISLEDQTLRADERDLLEQIEGKAGFVRLKYPYRLWLNSFQDFANENAYLIRRTDSGGFSREYVSGQQCRNWATRVQDANNPFTEPSIYRELMTELFEDDSEVTLSGPAVNASFNKSGSSMLNMLAYCYKNYMHDSDPRLFEILTENYTLCLETTRLIQRCVAGVTGSAVTGIDLQTGVIEYENYTLRLDTTRLIQRCVAGVTGAAVKGMDLQTGVIEYALEYGAPIDNQDSAAQLCNANHTLYEAVTRLQAFCAEIRGIYRVNFNGIPVTSQLRQQQIEAPGSSINDQASFQEQLQYFKKAVSIVADIKWHLEQDLYHEAIFLDGHMGLHQNMFQNPLMMNNSYEADYVFCVKCDFWPEEAKEWITRKRASGFPGEDLVDKVVRGGIHIVPKSFPGAGDEALCWRYSFSLPEITLVQNWTKVQRFTYLIVKSIYYEQLYVKLGAEKGKFSSYHIKTIMLWAVEKHPADWWNPDDITPCIQRLLDDIITALATRQLAHYFLREINLLEDSDRRVTDFLLYKAKQVVDCIGDYPARERIEQITTNIHKLQVMNQQLTQLKQVLTFREVGCSGEPKTPSFLIEQLFGADVLETGWDLEPVMGLHDMHVKDFTWQVIAHHTSGEQTIQDVLTLQEPSPDGEHTNWLELIQDFLVQHVNLPGQGSVQELELDQDSTQILQQVASKAYLRKLLRYLITDDLHPAVFAMCRRINLSSHFLEYLTRGESERLEELKLFSIGEKAARAFVLDTERLTTQQNVSNLNSERILTYHRVNTDQEHDTDEECTPGSMGHTIQEGIHKWNSLVSSEQGHRSSARSETLEGGLTSEQRSTLTDYILPVLSYTDSEEFHTRMTLQLLKALEQVVTTEAPFPPAVLAVLSLLHTVQCNYERRLMAAFQSARENYTWHIPGGLD